MSETELLIADMLLFLGLGCLALGHVMATRDHRFKLPGEPVRHLLFPRTTGHLVSAFGYLTFGFYWVMQVEHFLEINDPVNALFCFLALPFFGYLAYHEKLSHDWDEVYDPLRWLGATAVVAGVIYFSVDRIPVMTGWLVKIVADQSAWLITNLFDFHVNAGGIDYGGDARWFRAGSGHEVVRVPFNAAEPMDDNAPHINIVLACTALQSMIVFIGGILCTKADNDRRWKAFMITVPVIYVLNLFRNAIVALLVYDGYTNFEVAHSYVGKGGSLIVLVFLAVGTFTLLPELHDNILGLFDLPKRKKGGVPPRFPKDEPEGLEKSNEFRKSAVPKRQGGSNENGGEGAEDTHEQDSEARLDLEPNTTVNEESVNDSELVPNIESTDDTET